MLHPGSFSTLKWISGPKEKASPLASISKFFQKFNQKLYTHQGHVSEELRSSCDTISQVWRQPGISSQDRKE